MSTPNEPERAQLDNIEDLDVLTVGHLYQLCKGDRIEFLDHEHPIIVRERRP
jgi:hypothetical protein